MSFKILDLKFLSKLTLERGFKKCSHVYVFRRLRERKSFKRV